MPEVFELAGDFGRRELEAEKARLAKAVAAAEAKADMHRRARAPLRGISHGVQQREMFGGDLFTNPTMRRKRKSKKSTRTVKAVVCRKKGKCRHKSKVKAVHRRKPRRKTTSRRAARPASSGFFHAIKRPGHVDIYHVTKGKPEFVTCLKSWELAAWAKRKGIAIK